MCLNYLDTNYRRFYQQHERMTIRTQSQANNHLTGLSCTSSITSSPTYVAHLQPNYNLLKILYFFNDIFKPSLHWGLF